MFNAQTPSEVHAHAAYCMYVWSSHVARVRINRVRLPILLGVSWTEKIIFSLSPFAPENLVSRDEFGSPVPYQPAHLHTVFRLNLVLTGFIPSSAAAFIYLFVPLLDWYNPARYVISPRNPLRREKFTPRVFSLFQSN